MSKNKIVKRIRLSRVWHRYIGTSLAFFLLISALTGILLSLKKDISFLQPPTQKVSQLDGQKWLSIEEMQLKANEAFYQKYPEQSNNRIKRMDVRPNKGIAKVIYENGDWEVQINAYTGAQLSIAKRHSDWIERLHDGSIISDVFKVISMNFLGIGLVLMITTGLWLWYGPKRFRKLRRRRD